MQKKLNFKLVGITLGIFFLGAVVVHFLHGFQLARNAHRLLERASQAVAEQELDKALPLYEQYLGFVPDDTDTVQKLAQVLDLRATNVRDRVRLIVLMEQVLRVKPDEQALRMRLVHNLIALDRIPEALGQLQKLQTVWTDKADLLHMIGWCHDANKEYAEAIRAFEQAIKINPAQLKTNDLWAEVLQDRMNQPDDARKVMDDMVKTNANSWRAHLVRGRFHRRRGEAKLAQSDLERAFQLGNDQPEVILEVADARQASGDWQAAVKLLELGAKRNPDNIRFYIDLAHAKMTAGKPAEAFAHLNDGLKHAPKSAELAILAIDLMIDLNQYAEARRKIEGLPGVGASPAVASYLKARLLVAENHWSQAIPLLESARTSLAPRSEWSARVNMLLGLSYRHLGDSERELQSFRRAAQAEPIWSLANIKLGETLLSVGLIQDASQTLEPLRTQKQIPDGYWALLTRCRLQQQMRLPAAKRRWESVEAALAKVPAPTRDLIKAECLTARGDLAGALRLLQGAGANPEDINVACWRADLAARAGKVDDAEQTLEAIAAQAKFADRIEWRLALAHLWATRGRPEDRAKLDRLAGRYAKSAPLDLRVRLWRALAETWLRLGDRKRAEALNVEVAKALPGDLTSRAFLFEAALQRHRLDAARRWRNEIRAIEGAPGGLWRWADVALLLHEAPHQRDRFAEAGKKLQELEKLYKDWPRVAVLAGMIHELDGQPTKAIREYSRALELGETQPRVLANLLALLVNRREFGKAEAEITKYEQRLPLPRELARLGAEIALGLRDKHYAAIALHRAEQAVEPSPRDYRDALWLARVCRAAGENTRAESLLRRALEQASHAPDTWIAWMDFLTSLGRRAEALEELKLLKKSITPNRLALTLARCYEVMRLFDEADRAYQNALAAAPSDFTILFFAADFYRHADRPSDARKHYERLLAADTGAGAGAQMDARRQLAILLGQDGIPARSLALLDANQASTPESIADARIRLFLRSLDPAKQQSAIDQFQESLRQQPGTQEERLLFAAMLASAEHLGLARAVLADLTTESPFEPQFLDRFARVLIRMGDLDEAERTLARLDVVERGSPRVRQIRALIAKAKQP